MQIKTVTKISDIPQHLWQADSPFTSQAYWRALEDNALIGEATDWDSRYVLVYDANQAIAMLPIFIKSHHQGEYVFDQAWARAFYQYGINYYPRLVTSVPFTPVVGHRIWLAPDVALNTKIIQAFNQAITTLAQQLNASSWHGLFINKEQKDQWHQSLKKGNTENPSIDHSVENQVLDNQVLERHGCQFLWHNQAIDQQPFSHFDDFLAKLTAKKRKNIRAERRKVAKAGIHCQWKLGDPSVVNDRFTDLNVLTTPITDDDWQTFFQCYVMTYAVRGQQPYLTLDFFKQLAKSMPEHLALAQAVNKAGDVIACALFFYDNPQKSKAKLYGRYWGALADIDCLHFELCYYQGISFAIALGLPLFDPGTQGEHKLIRGFEPTISHSLHKVFVPAFIPAIANFCKLEQVDIANYAIEARQALPFKNDDYSHRI